MDESRRPLFQRPFLRGTLLLLFLPLIGSGCDDVPDPSGPAALVDAWVEMWNSYDLNRVGDLFLDDHRLTYFSSEREGVIRGFQEVVEHHEGFGFVPGGVERGTRLWVEGLHADVFEEAAVLTGIWYFQRAVDPTGVEGTTEGGAGSEPGDQPQKGPVTFVCLHEDGAWRFVHMSFGEYLPEESETAP